MPTEITIEEMVASDIPHWIDCGKLTLMDFIGAHRRGLIGDSGLAKYLDMFPTKELAAFIFQLLTKSSSP